MSTQSATRDGALKVACRPSRRDRPPADWREKRLRFAVSLNPSWREAARLKDEDEVSFVPMEAVGEFGGLDLSASKPIGEIGSGYTFFADGDVVVAKITPCFENGKGALAQGLRNGVAFGTTELHVLRAKPTDLDPAYLFYLSISPPFRAFGAASMYGAGGQKRVPEDFIKDFRWPLPPLVEQRAIAGFLDRETARIDGLIEKKRRLIELLQEKRAAVLSRSTLGKLDGGSPLGSPLSAWMGALPSGWKPLPIKFACSLLKDGTHLPPPRVSEGVPLLSVRNIIDGKFVLRDDDSNISEADYEDLCRSFVPKQRDVLLAIVGATIGKTALVPDGLGPFHVQRSLAVLRTKASVMKPEWLNLVFQTNQFRELLLQHVGYSAQPGIYLGSLANFMIPTPPLAEQEAICLHLLARLSAIDLAANRTRESIALLTEQRAALIAAAVTGQIDVREAV